MVLSGAMFGWVIFVISLFVIADFSKFSENQGTALILVFFVSFCNLYLVMSGFSRLIFYLEKKMEEIVQAQLEKHTQDKGKDPSLK